MFSLNNVGITPSRILLVFFSGMHFVAFAAIVFVDLSVLLTFILISVLLVNYYWVYTLHIRLTDALSVVRIYWDVNLESLRLQQRNGQWLDVERIKQQTVFPFAVLLQLKVEQRLLPIFVFLGNDSCSREDFRRLRVNCMFLGGKYFNARKSSQG